MADGDLAARVPRTAPDELASLADSFNQMAAELEESERQRRDIIANTAHELRTPLTNLEGYLEAIRDGVIVPDQQTYDSLLEETERLVRLAHSLDDLAAGDRAAKRAHPIDVDLAALLAARGRAGPAGPRGAAADDRAPLAHAAACTGGSRPVRPGAGQPAPERRALRTARAAS